MENFVMQEKEAMEFLSTSFSAKERSVLKQAIFEGYKFIDTWLKDEVNVFLGFHLKEVRGRAINWAIDYFVAQLIEKKAVNLSCRYEYTDISKIPFLVLYNDDLDIEMTISQVASRNKIARPSKDRTNRIEPYQSKFLLFSEKPDELKIDKPNYFQLTHGYQQSVPDFIVIGLPGDNGKWIGSVDILKELSVLEGNDGIQSEAFEFTSPSFEDLEELLNNN